MGGRGGVEKDEYEDGRRAAGMSKGTLKGGEGVGPRGPSIRQVPQLGLVLVEN